MTGTHLVLAIAAGLALGLGIAGMFVGALVDQFGAGTLALIGAVIAAGLIAVPLRALR